MSPGRHAPAAIALRHAIVMLEEIFLVSVATTTAVSSLFPQLNISTSFS